MANTETDSEVYDVSSLKSLDQISHIRHRIGMYLSGSGSTGMTVALRELIDNASDEFEYFSGAGEIVINFYEDGSAEVSDHGRGIPTGLDKDGISGIELALGRVGSGGKFNSKSYKNSSGLNGVGSSATNATSTRMDATVYQNGQQFQLSFREGRPGHWSEPNNPASKFTVSSKVKVEKDPRTAKEQKRRPTGTTIRFWPDRTVFDKDAHFLVDDIKIRMKSIAFLVSGMRIVVNDYVTQPGEMTTEEYHYDGGIAEMVPTLTHHPLVTKTLLFSTSGAFTANASVMDDDGQVSQQEVNREVEIELAYAYTNMEDSHLASFVNNIKTHNGGTHESGMWRALSRVWVNHIKNTKGYLKAKEEPPTLDDVKDGFAGVLSIRMPEPTFTGQEKSTLNTQEVTAVVSQALGMELQRWIDLPKNKNEVKRFGTKIVEASRIRLAAKASKDTARKKSALESAASLPAKLVACSSDNPDEIELHICEGESALGGLKNSRDSRTVALYPLKGKPLNAYDTPLGTILKNQEWADLIQIVGAGMGKEFNVDQMRYSRIVLLADGDADGSHIRVLLIAGFWRLMRPLVEAGKLYVALPPLFSITTKGKNKERFYALNEEERDTLVKKLTKQGKTWDKIQRHKGLGEYSPEILEEVVMNPATRALKQVTVEDIEMLESVLELTMGKNAAGRRDWIVENRSMVSDDEIDM